MTAVPREVAATRRPDVGRVVMVPLMAALMLLDLVRVFSAVRGEASPMRAVTSALTAAFYLLVVVAYLRRLPASASTRSRAARLAALVATWMTFAFPLLPRHHHGTATVVVVDTCLIAGTAWCAWCLAVLGRSFSVVAQARAVVTSGPYRWVRHPLYLGELVSCIGLAVDAGGVPAWLTWCVLLALQLFRTVHEERVLATLPGYAAYRATTRRLVPGLV